METVSATSCRLPSFSGLRPCRNLTPHFSSPTVHFRQAMVKAEYNRRENVRIKHERIRKKLSGSAERPRLAVFRSNHHIHVQVIDDNQMHTLAAVSTLNKSLKDELKLTSGPTILAAQRVGEEIAKLCLSKGISKVAFDRGGFAYHGRIKALAEAAREHGLIF